MSCQDWVKLPPEEPCSIWDRGEDWILIDGFWHDIDHFWRDIAVWNDR